MKVLTRLVLLTPRVMGVYPIRLDSGGGNAKLILILHDGSYPVMCTSMSKQKIILL
jgi:hypothetical protein